MDALALLCNLHADGPTTLDELHRIGVRGLGDVLHRASGTLVDELGWNAAAAERFVREAGHLSSRLGETLLDPEEGDEPATAGVTARGHARGGVDAVLRQWRELDDREPPVRPTSRPAAARERTALPPEVRAALDPGSFERLAEMGLDSLDELIGADPLELARGLRTGYSRALRLQFLAKRAQVQAPAPTSSAAAEAHAAPTAPATPSGPAATVAGPFA
ncbi:MAG: hypothetical protein WD226_12570 [Planctomycetota bacterium]